MFSSHKNHETCAFLVLAGVAIVSEVFFRVSLDCWVGGVLSLSLIVTSSF